MESDKESKFTQTWTSPADHAGWWMVVNNQPLGKRFMVTAFAFFVIGGVLALLMRTQLGVAENTFLGPEAFNRLFTMHGSTMMFLFAVPFLEGLALYLMPLLVGTRDVAFPRLTSFSYWTYLCGGIIFYASFLADAVPDAGWFAYTPLSGPEFSGLGMEFWLLGLTMVEIAGITAGVELVVTILKMRAPGMSLNRMPMFAWAVLVMGASILFAFTTLLTATIMLELDFSLGTKFFHPDYGGSTLLWQHLFWIFGHPEVYIMFIPAAGIVSMVVPVFARRPLAGYMLVAMSLVVTGFVGFGLWVHHMYTTGLPELSLALFTVASFMVSLASGVQVFAWIATMWGRRPVFSTSFLFILGFLFLFLAGGITGVMIAVVPFDWQVHDTYFLVAHFHYVLIGGVVFPIFAGLYYWIPKITGRMLNETLGKWNFWIMFGGMNATFFIMHLTGMQGMPRRVYTYSQEVGLEPHNLLSTVGAFLFGFGVLLFLINLVVSHRKGKLAANDPWNGSTIEWSTTSPPPVYSFYSLPIVRSRNPLWEPKIDESSVPPDEATQQENARVENIVAALSGAPATWRGTLITDAITATPQAIHRLPGPTYVPLTLALSIMMAAVGVLVKVYVLFWLGLLLSVGTLAYWLRPDNDVLTTLRASDLEERTGLPIFKTGTHSPGWWGNITLIIILATILATLIFSHLYIRLYSEVWPQANLPLPDVLFPGLITAGLLASVGPLLWARSALRKGNRGAFQLGTGIAVVLGLIYLAAKVWILGTLDFTPQTNAYGSLFFVIGGYMCLVLGLGLALQGSVLFRIWRGDLEQPSFFPLHIQIGRIYWLFTVAASLFVYGILYISPHL